MDAFPIRVGDISISFFQCLAEQKKKAENQQGYIVVRWLFLVGDMNKQFSPHV